MDNEDGELQVTCACGELRGKALLVSLSADNLASRLAAVTHADAVEGPEPRTGLTYSSFSLRTTFVPELGITPCTACGTAYLNPTFGQWLDGPSPWSDVASDAVTTRYTHARWHDEELPQPVTIAGVTLQVGVYAQQGTPLFGMELESATDLFTITAEKLDLAEYDALLALLRDTGHAALDLLPELHDEDVMETIALVRAALSAPQP